RASAGRRLGKGGESYRESGASGRSTEVQRGVKALGNSQEKGLPMGGKCRPRFQMDLERLRWGLPGLVLMAMAVTVALPTRAEAQAVCNAGVNLTYTIPSGHNFLLPPEPVTVNVQLTTGTISGGVGGNFADVNRVRFMLDCDPANGLFVNCPNLAPGNEVSYDGDTHISVGGTCVDQNGSPVTMKSSLPAGGSGS